MEWGHGRTGHDAASLERIFERWIPEGRTETNPFRLAAPF